MKLTLDGKYYDYIMPIILTIFDSQILKLYAQ